MEIGDDSVPANSAGGTAKPNVYGPTANSESVSAKTIDNSTRYAGHGKVGAAAFTVINGLNIFGGLPKMPVNTDHQGYTFFTRPQLNLTYDNVITARRMSAYANQSTRGAANAIRCLLQPPGFVDVSRKSYKFGIGVNGLQNELDVRSEIVDDSSPFINVLSNTLLTINGFPDFAPDTFTSNEGIAKEVASWVDDRPSLFAPFDITANFANMDGDFLTHLFHCWVEYSTRVATGEMAPFPVNIIKNRIDYNTKIYRFTMDRSKRYIQNIAATIAYPVSVPLGGVFNFNAEDKLNMEAHQVSVSFRCVGVEYNDPILIKEFNQLVGRFHPNIRETENNPHRMIRHPGRINYEQNSGSNADLVKGNDTMVKIDDDEKIYLNFKCYPWIANDNELEWWVDQDDYARIRAGFDYNKQIMQTGSK